MGTGAGGGLQPCAEVFTILTAFFLFGGPLWLTNRGADALALRRYGFALSEERRRWEC